MKWFTLSYLIKDNQICLGLKKRGFGVGKWNGFGGKVEKSESVVEAAIRELNEESLVTVDSKDLRQVLDVEFFFKDGKHLRVPTFFVHQWKGDPTETEEMKPAWFDFDKIPYDKMWSDDIYWMPRVFKGETLRGKVWFEEDVFFIEKMEWEEVDRF